MAESKYFNPLRHRVALRSPNAFVLASVVSGFAWYFSNQQSSHFAQRQQELVGRVEREESGENCKSRDIQSRRTSTASRQATGSAKR